MYTASGFTFGVFIFRFREEVGPKSFYGRTDSWFLTYFLKAKQNMIMLFSFPSDMHHTNKNAASP